MVALVVALLFVAPAAAQQTQAPLDPNAIMGFENLGTWKVTGNSSPPGFMVASTSMRTQGSAAYSIANPPNLVKVISQPIASTATALTGIGEPGALLQIDVLIPVQQGNAVNSGYIQPYVTSRSRGLSKVALAQVFFNNRRPGIYNTFGFAIPDAVSSALGGATFSDLTFEFDVSSPGQITGTYLFDNLRVHSVPLVQSPFNQPLPPGYGGSVNLVVFGDAPVTETFNLDPAQIPNGFHLKLGTFGSTTVKLQLGLDGNPSLTCTYDGDATDSTDESYILNSCDGGFLAGDLVNANWVYMAIVGGVHAQKIRAQLALNPMGDLTGAGLIPPMPTFWGDADTCTPAPVAGMVVTTSTSCTNQTAQANKIITDYFDQVNNANPAPTGNWIVPPAPEFALRHGDGTPNNNLIGPPPKPNDPPFYESGDLNPGGSFDAYWVLQGDLTPMVVPGTDENKTTFNAEFFTNSVLFGLNVDVAEVKVTAETDSAETTPTPMGPISTGSFELYLFENKVQSAAFTPSAGVNLDYPVSHDFDFKPIQIWIFVITFGVTAEVELKVTGPPTASGLDLVVTPSASLGVHITGGVGIAGVISGGVDAEVNLITLSTPVTAQTTLVTDTRPSICAYELGGSLKGDLTLGSAGGMVNLVATLGSCPLCLTESYTLFKWDSLLSTTSNLFTDTSVGPPFLGLPASMCSFPITVGIASPAPGASLSSGLPITLKGSAKPNDATLPYTSTYKWTYTPGTNASTVSGPTTGANPTVTFGAPTSGSTSTWTINVSGTVTVNSAGGTQVTSTASATPVTVTVSNPTNPVYITELLGSDGTVLTPDANGFIEIDDPVVFTVYGLVVGASGTLNSAFSVATCNDGTPACTSPGPASGFATMNASSATPSAQLPVINTFTYYRITITTTANGSPFGTASVVIYAPIIF
jgi:hypothetical protein